MKARGKKRVVRVDLWYINWCGSCAFKGTRSVYSNLLAKTCWWTSLLFL